jgi:glucose/mannose-6-phosphate isomerase
LSFLRQKLIDFDVDVLEPNNLAKLTAIKLKGRIPVLVASEHLVGSAHAMKNQINEGAKTFSVLFDLPELNHHLLEGLRNPAQAKEYFYFLLFESELYTPRVSKRYPLTKEVIEKNEVEATIIKLTGKNKLNQAFELLAFGEYVALYLAILYGLDPSPIPWVDYFKEKLK